MKATALLLVLVNSAAAAAQTGFTSPQMMANRFPGTPFASFSSGLALTRDGAVFQALNGDAAFSLESASGVEFIGQLDFGTARVDERSFSRSGMSMRLGHERERGGAWMGVGVAGGSGNGPSIATRVQLAGRVRAVQLMVTSNWLTLDRMDSIAPEIRSFYEDSRYTDVELGGTRKIGHLHTALHLGTRVGAQHQTTWAFASAALPLTRYLDLVMVGGTRPVQPELGRPGGRFAQIGVDVRISKTPPISRKMPALEGHFGGVESLGNGKYTLRMITRASTVEIKGDMTDWQAANLVRSTRLLDTWELTFEAAPGVYQFNIRLDDGSWVVPAGIPSSGDGFGGATALLVLS